MYAFGVYLFKVNSLSCITLRCKVNSLSCIILGCKVNSLSCIILRCKVNSLSCKTVGCICVRLILFPHMVITVGTRVVNSVSHKRVICLV